MKLNNEFTVAAPIDRTWATLLDVERVGGCLPGAQIDAPDGDGVFRGRMKMKLGPMTVAYEGSARLLEVDEDARTTVMEVQAREAKGQGTAGATIRNELEEIDGGTRVRVVTDLQVTGRQAQFGRGIMEDVAGRMLGQFAKQLEQLVADAEAAPAPGTGAAANGAAAGATASSSAGSTAAGQTSTPRTAAAEPEVLDLGSAIGGDLAKKAGLAAAVLALVALVIGIRRSSGGRRLSISIDLKL
jgi:carbon monoxide dehydrogenase subunit G